MDEYLKNLEREILELKTGVKKSSSIIGTKVITSNYSTGLRLVSTSSGYRANFKRMLHISLISKSGRPLLATVTLPNQDFLGRSVDQQKYGDSEVVKFDIWVYGNSDDVAKLQNGEDVNLNYSLKIIVSEDCDVVEEYEDVG